MSPETIRARALECMHLAQSTEDDYHRSHLLDVGHLCADLANALDRFQLFADAVEESPSEPVILHTPAGPHHRLAGPASATLARRARSDSSAARPEPQHRRARAKPERSRHRRSH